MRSLLHLTLIITQVGLFKASPVCRIPMPEEDVDWSKMSGVIWTGLMSTDDPIGNTIRCGTLFNITQTSSGFTAVGSRKIGEMVKYLPMKQIRIRNSIYMSGTKAAMAKNFTSDKETGEIGEADVVNDLDRVLKDAHLWLTDYDTYLIYVGCSSTGRWAVWPFFQSSTLKATHFEAVNSVLNENHIFAKLYPYDCAYD